MDIFRTDIEVIRPEHLGLPAGRVGFIIKEAGIVFPSGTQSSPIIGNSTMVDHHSNPVVLELKGLIHGVGLLNLTHYCQPVIDRLGYIRDVIVEQRDLGIQMSDGVENNLREMNDGSASTGRVSTDGSDRHRVTVKSAFGFSTRIEWENGVYLLGVTIDKLDTMKMHVTHVLKVKVQICLNDEMARIAYVNRGKEEARAAAAA